MQLFLPLTIVNLFLSLSKCDYNIISENQDDSFARFRRDASSISDPGTTISSVNISVNSTTMSSTAKPAVSTTVTAASTTASTLTTNVTLSTTPASVVDQHPFYVTQLFDDFDRFWVELYFGKVDGSAPSNFSNVLAMAHDKLSVSYRTAAVVDLKFTFPFYGQPVKRVVIATGGFIYVGEVLNPRLLTFSQFIAPLMANFDFSLGDFSSKRLLYFSNETVLIVEWRDVVLQEHPSLPFRFQIHIYRDGRIIFAYKDIPIDVNTISVSKHPVEISLSDAYASEKRDVVSGASYQTMHIYSETSIPHDWVRTKSVVVITPLPTCISLTSCKSCLTPAPNLAFKCAWCPNLRRCSYGFDRGRKSWMDSKCDEQNTTQAAVCDTLPLDQREGSSLFSPIKAVSYGSTTSSGNSAASSLGGWAVLIVLIVVAILAAVGLCVGWVVYAHKHPGSRAGIWLVEHRPSRILHDSGDFFRRGFASARSWWSSAKPAPSASGHFDGRQQPVVSFNGPNQPQQQYDVNVGGVTLSATRI